MLKTLPSGGTHTFGNLKCGEVYCNTPTDYSVSCCFCTKKVKFNDFQKHFRKLHLTELEESNQVAVGNDGSAPWVAMAPANEAEEDPFKHESDEEMQIEMLVEVDPEEYTKKPDTTTETLEKTREETEIIKNELSFIDDETPIDIVEVKWTGAEGKRVTRANTASAKSNKNIETLPSSVEFPKVTIKIESGFEHAGSPTDNENKVPGNDDGNDDVETHEYLDASSDEDFDAISSSCSEAAKVDNKSFPYPCTECIRGFRTKKGLQKHTANVHKPKICKEEEEKSEKEDLEATASDAAPGAMAKTAKSTKKKKKGAKKERPFKCEKCGDTFTEEKLLQYHDMRKHTGIICDICGQSFSQIGNMQRHKIRHTGRKDFQCKECDKTFFTDKELAAHMLRHTQIWPHICDICGKRCRDGGVLTIHMRRHTGERPYKCNVCGKGFYEGHDRNIHQLSHFNERPFTCDVCSSSFRHKKALRVHKKIHSTERNHVCKICGKAFAQSAGLVAHMRSHAAFVGQLDTEARIPLSVEGAVPGMMLDAGAAQGTATVLSQLEESYETKTELQANNEQSINGVF